MFKFESKDVATAVANVLNSPKLTEETDKDSLMAYLSKCLKEEFEKKHINLLLAKYCANFAKCVVAELQKKEILYIVDVRYYPLSSPATVYYKGSPDYEVVYLRGGLRYHDLQKIVAMMYDSLTPVLQKISSEAAIEILKELSGQSVLHFYLNYYEINPVNGKQIFPQLLEILDINLFPELIKQLSFRKAYFLFKELVHDYSPKTENFRMALHTAKAEENKFIAETIAKIKNNSVIMNDHLRFFTQNDKTAATNPKDKASSLKFRN